MQGISKDAFEGFAPEDFDAFDPRKWRSNRFNLERMRVRDKLASLGRAVLAEIPEVADRLRLEQSDPTPSIFNGHEVRAAWLCLRRQEAEQRFHLATLERVLKLVDLVQDPDPRHTEVILSGRLDHEGLEVSLRMHAHARVDARNLCRRLRDDAAREQFLELLRALPGGAELTVGDTSSDTAETLDEARIEALEALCGASDGWFRVSRTFRRDDPALASTACVETIASLLVALRPLRDYIAWGPDNDWLDLGELTTPAASAPATATPRQARNPSADQAPDSRLPAWANFRPPPRPSTPSRPPKPRSPQTDTDGNRRPPREAQAPTGDSDRKGRPRREEGRPRRRDDDRRRGPRRDRDSRGGAPRTASFGPTARDARKKDLKPSDKPLEAGCMARVTEGLFQGQIGKLIEIDRRGDVRLIVNERTLRVPADQLVRVE